MTRKEALRLRAIVEQAAASLPDKEASEGAALFPRLKQDGALVKAGTRINWNGTLKRAAVDLWDNEQSTPDAAPDLWSKLDFKDGYRYIPETITVSLAFSKGERGWWTDGKLYESIYEGQNVWTPTAYPAGWKIVRNDE